MKSTTLTISILTTLLTLAACTSSEVIPHDYECDIYIGTIKVTAPIPEDAGAELVKRYEETVCDSIEFESDIMDSEIYGVEAVCDTDANCDLWDTLKNYNVKGVYVVENTSGIYNNEVDQLVSIVCEQHNSIVVIKPETLDKAEYPYICKDPKDIVKYLNDGSNQYGYFSDFTLNYDELETLLGEGIADPNKSTNNTPKTYEFATFMNFHPETRAGGYYRNEKAAKELCEAVPSGDIETCIDNNTGLVLTEVYIPFADKMPTWLIDFCKEADEKETNPVRCWWD